MKTLFFQLIISLLCGHLVGQSLKTFNGQYEDGTVNKGFANYTYYEDAKTHEYVRHGKFSYTYSDKNEISSYNLRIEGNYKHNKRDGIWSYTITLVDWPSNGDAFVTGTKSLVSNYQNGKPNGSWLYKFDAREREKRYSLLGFTWTPYKNVPSELASATFQNGTLANTLKLVNYPTFNEYRNVTGQFDSFGNMQGIWSFKSAGKEKTMEFKNGILISQIIRELSSGRIITKEIDDENMLQIKTDFINGKVGVSEVAKHKIKIDTIFAVNNDEYDFNNTFKSSEFRFEYISGDESYYYDKKWIDNRNEGRFIRFNQTKTYQLKDLKEFQFAEEFLGREDYKKALVYFEYVIRDYRNNLSETDIVYINKKIEMCNFEVVKIKKGWTATDLYESIEQANMHYKDDKKLKIIDSLLNYYSDVLNNEKLSTLRKKREKLLYK